MSDAEHPRTGSTGPLLERVEDRVARIEETLYGNGAPGLRAEIVALKQSVETMSKIGIALLISITGGIVMLILQHVVAP